MGQGKSWGLLYSARPGAAGMVRVGMMGVTPWHKESCVALPGSIFWLSRRRTKQLAGKRQAGFRKGSSGRVAGLRKMHPVKRRRDSGTAWGLEGGGSQLERGPLSKSHALPFAGCDRRLVSALCARDSILSYPLLSSPISRGGEIRGIKRFFHARRVATSA